VRAKTGAERCASTRARAARRPGDDPFDGARVTDDPVKIARIRYGLAFAALLEIRPWSKGERDLGRRVFDIAAGELDAALAEERGNGAPAGPAAEAARPRPPAAPRPASANDRAGFADG
jgi:hypothetical protein